MRKEKTLPGTREPVRVLITLRMSSLSIYMSGTRVSYAVELPFHYWGTVHQAMA